MFKRQIPGQLSLFDYEHKDAPFEYIKDGVKYFTEGDVPYSDETHELIYKILIEHQGKEHAIPAWRISQLMNFSSEDTQSTARRYIWETAKLYGIPLVGDASGYYIAIREEEINEYNESIHKRINGMLNTLETTNKNYKEWLSRIDNTSKKE